MKQYSITTSIIEKNGITNGTSAQVTEAQYKKIQDILNPKVKEKKIVLPYKDLGKDNESFEDILNDTGELDLELVQEILEDGDYCDWDDETGHKDNAKPFRLLINNKYLIEWEVERGECIEATWDHRIWGADCVRLKLIETK